MVNCNYCNKQIDRLVFCSPSHKVMYHRRGPIEITTTPMVAIPEGFALKEEPDYRSVLKKEPLTELEKKLIKQGKLKR